MAKSATDKILDASLKDHVDVLRLSEEEKRKAELLLIRLSKQITNKIVGVNPTGTQVTAQQKQRLQRLYTEVRKIVKANFNSFSKDSQETLFELGELEAVASAKMVNDAIGVEVMNPTLSRERVEAIIKKSTIDGKVIGEWWESQTPEFVDRFRGAMEEITKTFQVGMLGSQTLGQMISTMSSQGKVMGMTRNNVEALIRTSYMQVAADIRQEMYKKNADILEGTKWISTLDARTTPLCRALDGSMWDMSGNPIRGTRMRYHRPPAHWRCRSTTIPIILPYEEMLKERPELETLTTKQRASMNGPVSSDLDYGAWLKSLPKEEQIEILGKARHKLFKKGNLSMAEMIKLNGNPLTIKELRAKVERKLRNE